MASRKIRLPFLQIEPTTQCNYNCGFCVGRHIKQQHMELDVFERAIESIEGLHSVSIQGEGEPLLNPDFFKMVGLIKKHHPTAELSFITNGSVFSIEHVEKILAFQINRINVSIESPDATTFKAIRAGKLEKVIEGINRLIDRRNRLLLKKPLVGFAVTVLKSTVTQFPDIVKLYRTLRLDGGISIQFLQDMPDYTNIYSKPMKDEFISNIDADLFRSIAQADPTFLEIVNESKVPSFYQSLYRSETVGCPWLRNGLYVNADGTATGCCHIKSEIQEGFGKLSHDTAGEIAEKRHQMYQEMIAGTIPSPCRNCRIAHNVAERASLKPSPR